MAGITMNIGLWSKLENVECDPGVKDKASPMLVSALGDTALQVWSSEIGEPIKMLEMLDNRFASNRTATQISFLTRVCTKRFNARYHDMATYVEQFETLSAQLERMGNDTQIPKSHKARLLLATRSNHSLLESALATPKAKETDKLSWHEVTSDLIQEWNQLKGRNDDSKHPQQP